jgi:cell division cycle 2-like protein
MTRDGKRLLSDHGMDLLRKMLTPYPKKRISLDKALRHEWFRSEIASREEMPSHEAINEMDRVRKRVKKE